MVALFLWKKIKIPGTLRKKNKKTFFRVMIAAARACRPTIMDSPVYCTGLTFLSGCSTSCVQRFTDVCSTRHHSTWKTAASIPQTSLVGSTCGPPAAVSCSYRDTAVRFSVVRPFLWPARPGGLELFTRLPSRSDALCWQFLSWPENSSLIVLLA